MDLSRWLGQADASLTPRELSPEELSEMDRQLRMEFPSPGEEVVRKLQRKLYSDPWNKKWWEYPLLNQPYTVELPRRQKYAAKQFTTRRPVLLSPEQHAEQSAVLRKIRDEEQKAKLAKESNPLTKAWKYYMEAEAY